MIFVGPDGARPSNRDIVVYHRAEPVQRFSELNPHVDPMTYPLLFPDGNPPGWDPDMRLATERMAPNARRTRLTILQYYNYMLMKRRGCILPHAGGRLFQQYCVDAYCKIEGQRLSWVRNNQTKIRAEEYNVLRDWAQEQGATNVASNPSSGTAPAVGKTSGLA